MGGIAVMNGQRMNAGDGATLEDETAPTAKTEIDETKILVFDLP